MIYLSSTQWSYRKTAVIKGSNQKFANSLAKHLKKS